MALDLLQCLLRCTSGEAENQTLQFCQDEKKKSVFWVGGQNENLAAKASGEDSLALSHASTCKTASSEIFVKAPAESIISLSPSQETRAWAVGGFQLVSNARQVQVYSTATSHPPYAATTTPLPPLATASREGNESYIMTVKGLPVTSSGNGATNEKWYKALCAVPGGPRPVVSIRLVFDNLDAGGSEGFVRFQLQWLKLTARVTAINRLKPEVQQQPVDPRISSMMKMMQSGPSQAAPLSTTGDSSGVAASAPTGGNLVAQRQPQRSPYMPQNDGLFFPDPRQSDEDKGGVHLHSSFQNSEVPATASDVAASMAGLHFSLRSTEERIMEKIGFCHETFQEHLVQQQQQYLTSLQHILHQHQAWIEHKLEQQKDDLIKAFRQEADRIPQEIRQATASTNANATASTNESMVDSNRNTATDKAELVGWCSEPTSGQRSEKSLWKHYALMDLK
ncbi:hypothetical protein ACA910_000358 [Epithemia clementina (nom. ined.)]